MFCLSCALCFTRTPKQYHAVLESDLLMSFLQFLMVLSLDSDDFVWFVSLVYIPCLCGGASICQKQQYMLENSGLVFPSCLKVDYIHRVVTYLLFDHADLSLPSKIPCIPSLNNILYVAPRMQNKTLKSLDIRRFLLCS